MFINKQIKLELLFPKIKKFNPLRTTKISSKYILRCVIKHHSKNRQQISTNDIWWPNIYQELPNISK